MAELSWDSTCTVKADSIDIYTNLLKDFPEFATFVVLSRSIYQMFGDFYQGVML